MILVRKNTYLTMLCSLVDLGKTIETELPKMSAKLGIKALWLCTAMMYLTKGSSEALNLNMI